MGGIALDLYSSNLGSHGALDTISSEPTLVPAVWQLMIIS